MPEFKPQREATLAYDTGEREDDALSRMEWLVPAVFMSAALLLLFAATEWFAPYLPIVLFAAFIWAPVAALLILKKRRARLRSMVGALLLVASFGLPLMAWNIPAYRAAVLWSVVEITPFDAPLSAADDGSDLVMSIACGEVMESNHIGRTQRMRDALEQRPEVAARCLSGLDGEARDSSVHIGNHLRQVWYEGWMGERELDHEIGCGGARSYLELGEADPHDGVAKLLMCALDSPYPEFSQCCAEVISEQTGDEQILKVEPERWDHSLRQPLFMELSQAVDLPAHTLMAAEPVDSSLDWTPADLFHWTTHVGCHLMESGEHPEAIARRLSRTMETQCGLEVDDPLFSFAMVKFVDQSCAQISADRQRRIDVVQWCDVAREANRGAVVEAAKFLAYRATRRFDIDDWYEGMVLGGQLADMEEMFQMVGTSDDRSRAQFDASVGTDGQRMKRPDWLDHTPENRDRLERMRHDDFERRRAARERLAGEQPLHLMDDDKVKRLVDRAVTEQRREEMEEARKRGRSGGGD